MIPQLAEPPGRFTFIVGKGGVGKSTAAAALALAWSEHQAIHLISTDPAHSLVDVFARPLAGAGLAPCDTPLTVEELDAAAWATAWQERARVPLSELLGAGSYLNDAEIGRITSLPLPGASELAAALRLAELAESATAAVVVDTAPAGHTLRLLDAHLVLGSWLGVLGALARKGDAVARAFTGVPPRGSGARFRASLEADIARFRGQVLGQAVFLLATRAGELEAGETRRLEAELQRRGLRLVASLELGAPARTVSPQPAPGRPFRVAVPWLAEPARGCGALRSWAEELGHPGGRPPTPAPAVALSAGGAESWLLARTERLLLFAGKGGVGKSTCAAATALTLAANREVLLLGTGADESLPGLLQTAVGRDPVEIAPGLSAARMDAAAALAEWRGTLQPQLEPLLDRIGLGRGAELDRAVLRSIWEAIPPGLDELAALTSLLERAGTAATVVLDGAPTGHFLRLLELPSLALDWTRTLMRLLLEYRMAGELDALTNRVLAFARQLRDLRSRLADAGWTGAVVVTVAEPVIEAESRRLADRLVRAGVPITAVLTNLHAARQAAFPLAVPQLTAPLWTPPPCGLSALRRFTRTWLLQ